MYNVATKSKYLTLFSLLLILVLSILTQTHLYMTGDVDWLLHVTQSLLHDGHYNQDFFETNPPMILYLYMPPVLLSNFLHVNLITCFIAYIFIIALLIISICNILLKKIFPLADNNIRYALLIAISFAFLLLPASEFGQRDYLMAVLSLPYLLIVVMRAANQAINKIPTFILGLLAGIGIAIKPYFLITPFFVELYLILKYKKLFFFLRSETIAIALIIAAYLVTIAIFSPEYLIKTLPLVNSLYLTGLPIPLWKMLFSPPMLSWILLVCCCFAGKSMQPYREFDRIFLLAATGYLLSYIIQRAPWFYHWLPNLIITTLLATKIIACNYQHSEKYLSKISTWPHTSRLLQTLIACIVLTAYPWYSFNLSNIHELIQFLSSSSQNNNTITFFKKYAAHGSVYYFYPFDNPPYPAVDYTSTISSSRFPGLVLLPGLAKKLASHPDKKTLQEKQWIINAVVEDFYQHPPTLVFVDQMRWQGYYNNQRFDYLAFFSSDPRFARLFTCYAYLADFNGFKVYQNRCVKLPH